MEAVLQQILEGQNRMESRLDKLDASVNRMEARLDKIDGDIIAIKDEMGTRVQQDENNRLIAALLHRTEEMDARFDALLHNTASKEMTTEISQQQHMIHHRLDRIAMDVNFLVRKAAEHEADIFEFKKVK